MVVLSRVEQQVLTIAKSERSSSETHSVSFITNNQLVTKVKDEESYIIASKASICFNL